MEPKTDDPETISGSSHRSVENLVFLLNCPFYGAQSKREELRFLFVLNRFTGQVLRRCTGLFS